MLLTNLPFRLDDAMLAQVDAIALRPLPPVTRCTEETLLQCLRWIAAMPRKSDDELSGKARVAIYQRHLSGYPEPAIMHLAHVATGQHTFMPSIPECKAILATWQRSDEHAEIARLAGNRCSNEYRMRYDETMDALAARKLETASIAALSDRIKDIGVEKGYLWLWPDGSHTARLEPLPGDSEAIEAHQAAAADWRKAWAEHHSTTTALENANGN